MNSHRSVYKTDALVPVKLLRQGDCGFGIADFGLKKSEIGNPRSEIEMIAVTGIEPVVFGL